MIRKLFTLLTICFLCFVVISCIPSSKEGKSMIIDDKTFVDDMGKKFTIDEPYERVVSLYSAHTENICSLGKEEVLIGVNSTSIYPPSVAFLPIYDYKSDAESLVAANPDVVISRPFLSRNYPEYIRTLKNAGITVISLYPESSNEFEKYINILAMIVGAEDEVDGLFLDYNKKLDDIKRMTKDIEDKQTVFFESTKTNYRTVTNDSNPAKAIEIAGGINIAYDAKPMKRGTTIANFGIENLMMNAEEIDVYVSQRGAMNSGGSMISIPQREGFMAIKAVKEGRILELNEKIISSPTFRYPKGVKEIARALYPEIMDDVSAFRSDEMITREDYAVVCTLINHVPIFLPSSSHYYEKKYYNHTYGLFTDVMWYEDNFDDIETAVSNSFIVGYKDKDEKEYFDKDGLVTREDIAYTLYMMNDYKSMDSKTDIKDIKACEHGDIVQKIVDNGMLSLEDGYFNPDETVSYNFVIDILSGAKDD